VTVTEIEPELLKRDVAVVHPELRDPGQRGVAEAVLETEVEALTVIFQ
jgi:hypothetical protein